MCHLLLLDSNSPGTPLDALSSTPLDGLSSIRIFQNHKNLSTQMVWPRCTFCSHGIEVAHEDGQDKNLLILPDYHILGNKSI